MKNLVDKAVGQCLDGIFLAGTHLTKASAQMFDFLLAYRLKVLLQRSNRCLYLRLTVRGGRSFGRQKLLIHRRMLSGMHAGLLKPRLASARISFRALSIAHANSRSCCHNSLLNVGLRYGSLTVTPVSPREYCFQCGRE